jgi:hypothetical protein
MCDPVTGRPRLAAALKEHGAFFVDERLSARALSDEEGSMPVFPATSKPGLASQGQILSWLALRAIVSFIHDAESKAKETASPRVTPPPSSSKRLLRSQSRLPGDSGAHMPAGAFEFSCHAWNASPADSLVLFCVV